MAIGSDNKFPKIIITEGSAPSSPSAGDQKLYIDSADHKLKRKNSSGNVTTIEGGAAAITNSSISPTTTNVSAAVNYRYFADVSGLTANRNFILPAGAAGDEIEINITVGDDTYALIVLGDTGITINGGSAATEWSRLFISGESVRLIATSATNWQIVNDGRIPCVGLMTLSADDTTNTAGAATLPTWDNAVIDIGNICSTANKRFNIRRAGYYRVSGAWRPYANIADQKYMLVLAYLNGTGGTLINSSIRVSSLATTLYTCDLSPASQLCAVGDYIGLYYQTEEANKGASIAKTFFQVEEM